jgi:ectoine hydroxylase-related dioxygenase (phytanoyl-CoA dioxygenase family)
MTADYILPNITPETFVQRLDEIVEIYNEYGVIILPGFLNHDPNYVQYIDELNMIFDRVMHKYLGVDKSDLEIGEKLTFIGAEKPELGKIIADLGTQHNKFFAFNKVKYADYIQQFHEKIWGDDALIATPQAGDTLHLFPPGKVFHRYNLPPHQDYQYLLQSPQQTTFYFGVSKYHDGVGGLKIWEKSHKLGVMMSTKNENGAFEVHDWENALKDCKVSDFSWNQGDFGLFDSLLAHSSIPNTTEDKSRIVQIFRYSNLNDQKAESYDYYSTTYDRRGRDYVVEHADQYTAPTD